MNLFRWSHELCIVIAMFILSLPYKQFEHFERYHHLEPQPAFWSYNKVYSSLSRLRSKTENEYYEKLVEHNLPCMHFIRRASKSQETRHGALNRLKTSTNTTLMLKYIMQKKGKIFFLLPSTIPKTLKSLQFASGHRNPTNLYIIIIM